MSSTPKRRGLAQLARQGRSAYAAAVERLRGDIRSTGITLADPLNLRELHLPLRATIDAFHREAETLAEDERRRARRP